MAAAPVHSQKPRCQKTESRSVAQIGFDQAGSSRARSNNASLQKMPANGSRVRADQIQNRRAAARSCRRAFHAHQQAQIIAKAKQPAAERPSNSCSRRIRKTSWLCCGTTKQAQINATIPARRLTVLTRAARGAIALNCRRKYPANGSINNPVSANPPAASR